MPFKSRAQRRKFAALLLSGDITPEQYERWNRETGRSELPEHVKDKKKKRTKKKSIKKKTTKRRAR